MWDAVGVAQQWLSHTREAEHPVVIQFIGLDVSIVPIWHKGVEDSWPLLYIGIPKKLVLESAKGCCSNKVDGLAGGSKGKQAKSKVSFLHVLLCGCHSR